jgi:PIN domain nuclease of toxin-antitoxin system
MSVFVVDTHTLVWFFNQNQRLSKKAHAILQDAEAQLIIPVIVLAEIKYLSHKGRFASTLADILRVIETDARCLVYPINLKVIDLAPPELDIHDSLIVGTALAQPTPITGVLTADVAIRDSGLVPVVW